MAGQQRDAPQRVNRIIYLTSEYSQPCSRLCAVCRLSKLCWSKRQILVNYTFVEQAANDLAFRVVKPLKRPSPGLQLWKTERMAMQAGREYQMYACNTSLDHQIPFRAWSATFCETPKQSKRWTRCTRASQEISPVPHRRSRAICRACTKSWQGQTHQGSIIDHIRWLPSDL